MDAAATIAAAFATHERERDKRVMSLCTNDAYPRNVVPVKIQQQSGESLMRGQFKANCYLSGEFEGEVGIGR